MFEGKLFFEVFNKTVIKGRIKNKKKHSRAGTEFYNVVMS